MIAEIWTFLRDPSNQSLLSWIGGGVAVTVAAAWAVLKFLIASKPKAPTKPGPPAADRGSVAIGGDNKNSPINIKQSK